MSGGSKHDKDGDDEQHAGYAWLAFCVIGMVSSLTLYGLALEYATSGGRTLHEISFVFVTTSIYSMTAFIARWLFGEKPTTISKYHMLVLSCTSIASTYTSVRSLRYVIYPVQVLFKSCKPVPVLLFNKLLGKRYPFRKYVNVMIITSGVALFMGGGTSSSANNSGGESTLIGAIMLSTSLCFDGATGAYEDKLMGKDHVGPFDLMYNIQFGKAVISFITLVAVNQLGMFVSTLQNDAFVLILLGLTGALGQVFVFVTISKFGALNCALIGLCRKMLSLVLSFLLYGHTLNAIQSVGLCLAIVAMIANFYEKGGKKKPKADENAEAPPEENIPLMDMQDEEANNSENEGADDTPKGNIKSLLDLEEDESSSGEKRVDMKRRVELKENSV
mmetsp:Transcript_19982/g.28707  ORF Transcript_19982/g.28707 Transcript_19982/m.28707 type:complete len:389 (-) Transcript_19982:78-1244(-)|eukprot:CAMPEP_0185027874 /NCGR_PEP_ID=MMETSP1103-20130426/13146_1 /TAXON_ID=36769 /ORGANISM="Paraphysomonas bandaiensis, Strain Caron Lab Isolate" /LENGTH=388 /DNA_ID=CAMNT_0027562035 /DNA_START=33 /DNA_END=1199 /DNA_ORIENTATION=-